MKRNITFPEKNEKGFTLIEALIALAIFSIGILGVAAMQMTAINSNAIAHIQTDATGMAVDWMERLQRLEYTSDNTHDDLTKGDHGPITDGAYSIRWNVSDGPPQWPNPARWLSRHRSGPPGFPPGNPAGRGDPPSGDTA